MPMNPFASISRLVRNPTFARNAGLAGAAGLGATVPDAIGGAIDSYDEGIRDDTARDIIGGIMDAQEQEARQRAEQEQLYMQGASDAAEMMLGQGGDDGYGYGDDDGYGDYLGSGDGMYSLAMALGTAPKASAPAPGPSTASGVKPASPVAAGKPSIVKLNSALADVPGVLAEALGLNKNAVSPAAIGAAIGGGLGVTQGSGSERVRNALLGAALGGAGGHVVGNPTTRNSLAGMFQAASK